MVRAKLKSNDVRQMLLKRSLSQGNFARKIAVTSAYCSQLLSGDRCPSPDVRARIMEELKAQFDDVFEIVHPQAADYTAVN